MVVTAPPWPQDPATEELFLGIAHALFVNRLHVLRLTEVVRLGIRPDPHDQNMEVPQEVDRELIQQAFAYVQRHFPRRVQQQDRSRQGALDPAGVARVRPRAPVPTGSAQTPVNSRSSAPISSARRCASE